MDIEALKEQARNINAQHTDGADNQAVVRGRGPRWCTSELECLSQLSNGIPTHKVELPPDCLNTAGSFTACCTDRRIVHPSEGEA
jgi:hypothetical protein